MKKLLKAFVAEGAPRVHIHMKDGKIYADMKIEELSTTAFRAESKKGAIHLIQFEDVKQVKSE